MDKFTPIIYISFVLSILSGIAFFITKQILQFYSLKYLLNELIQEYNTNYYTEEENYKLSSIYRRQKLLTLVLNNIENALKEHKIQSKEFRIKSLKIIKSIYKIKNFKILGSKYDD